MRDHADGQEGPTPTQGPDQTPGQLRDRFGKLTGRARAAVTRNQHRDLFERFTKRARKAVALAQDEARRLNHDYIGTEHLLLGLLRDGEGVAAKVLTNLGVELHEARAAVERIAGRGDQVVAGEMRVTPRLKQVLALASDEAKRLKHHYVGTEHLLLALLREGEGVGGRVLTSFDVSLDRARAEVLSTLAGLGEAIEYGKSRTKNNVVMCRVDDQDLAAIDTLIEVGIRSTRSDAAAWLIHAGIEAKQPLFDKVTGTVDEIRRLRGEAQALAAQATAEGGAATGAIPVETANGAAGVGD